MNKINIYSIDMFDNHQYEFSTITKNNCSQTVMKVVSNNKLIKNVDKHNKNYAWFKKLINHNAFKQKYIVGLYASYK